MPTTSAKSWLRSLGAGLIAGGLAAAGAADAQSYPVRPIRMIIPFSAGGATDVPGRIIAQKLSAALGQQVIIDNRPGAGGVIGSQIVAKAQPDGYTMLLTGTAFALAPTIYHGKLPFDVVRDFAPVAQVAVTANALVVHPSLPPRSVKELIALAQSQPGKIDYASSGTGGAQHLMAALFLSTARVNMNHVAYKGSGPATADLLGGHVKVGFPGVAIVIPHARAGRLIPLGVTTAQRTPQLPDVPTIAEAGVPGYDAAVWYGILLPAGTPKPVIERLHGELIKLLGLPDARDGIVAAGYDIVTSRPEAFAAFLKADIAKWGRVIKEARIQPE
jgi:tripartite-type tricarboxylate transporter receptor subunit TctC